MRLSLSVFLRRSILLTIGILSIGVAAASDAMLVDRIVAVVNEDIITLYDLNLALQPYQAKIKALNYSPEKEREALFKLRAELLNQIIDEKLTDQAVKRNNIEVSEKEIDATIERIKAARSLTDEDIRAGIALQGLTMEGYRKAIKEQLLRSILVNREIKSKIVITEDEIKKYYEAHRENSAFRGLDRQVGRRSWRCDLCRRSVAIPIGYHRGECPHRFCARKPAR